MIDEMKTLTFCLNKATKDGYTGNFKITEEGLKSLETEKLYTPEEVHIHNFFRFEGSSDPSENAILYVIETDDGTKGTLTDAYGPYADPHLEEFITEVQDISKKNTTEASK
jgi:hypothetical protein